MGYAGSGVNKCTDCKKIKATGDMGICFDCAKKRVIKTELVCHICLHRNSPFEFKNVNREGSCLECGETKILNDESLCASCFKKLRVKDTNKCWGCQEDFIPLHPNEDFCQQCIKDLDYTN